MLVPSWFSLLQTISISLWISLSLSLSLSIYIYIVVGLDARQRVVRIQKSYDTVVSCLPLYLYSVITINSTNQQHRVQYLTLHYTQYGVSLLYFTTLRWWSSTPRREPWPWTGGTCSSAACSATRARWKTSASWRSRRCAPPPPVHLYSDIYNI